MVAKYDVEKYIKYQHSVKSACWDEDEGKWTVTVQIGDRTFDKKCDVFINAGGVLK